MSYTAIVLAGSRPGYDEFASQFRSETKALIPIRGEPMVLRPVRALLGSPSIGSVIVASQAPEQLESIVPTDARIHFHRSRGTIAETLLEIATDAAADWPLLITTADHALLDSAMVDEFIGGAEGSDITIGVVEKANLLGRLPGSERTWLKFRRGAYTGANLFALASPRVRPAIELWRSVEQDRKKAWRVLSLLGPMVMIAVALRLVTLDGVMSQLSSRLGLRIKAMRLSDPLAGVDVDKPADHALVEAILAGQA